MIRTSTLWILSSACFVLAFLHPVSEILIFPAFILLLAALKKTSTFKQVIFYSLMLGIIKGLGVLSWIWSVYPLSWLTNQSQLLQVSVIAVIWITAALMLALGTSFTLVTLHLCVKHIKKGLYVFPVLWIAGELFGALLYSLLTLGPGSSIQTHFSYGFVGYTIANFPLLKSVASIGGVYMLSFVVTAIALLIYLFIQRKESAKSVNMFSATVCLIICLIVGSGIHHHFRPTQDTQDTVISVSTNIDKTFMSTENSFATKRAVAYEALTQALTHSPNVVILPEDTRLVRSFNSLEEVFTLLGDTILIDSARTETSSGVVLRSYIFNPTKQTAYVLDKNYLVPHGEYTPYLQNLLLKQFLSTSTAQQLEEDLAYTTGKTNDYTDFPSNIPVILSCMESVWPSALYNRTEDHIPPFVAHTISHSWFTEPTTLWHQQDRMLQAQALWSNATIITAPNMAPQKVYRPSGKIEQGKLIAESEFWSLYSVGI